MIKSQIEIGDLVPHFILKDQHGDVFNIKDIIGKKKLVIYFYPEDESAICTKEACAFRDSYKDLENAGAIVIGINSATVASHRAFAIRNSLKFTLLSDPDNKVLKLFGIKSMLFITGRETFVVDELGRVQFKYRGFFNGSAHVENTLEYLKTNSKSISIAQP
jgi:peroxiredoxin Q/BCP